MSTKKVTLKFVNVGLAQAAKTDAQKLEEQITEFVEDAVIECETAIAGIKTSNIPSKELEIKRANAELRKAKAAFEKSRYTSAYSFC